MFTSLTETERKRLSPLELQSPPTYGSTLRRRDLILVSQDGCTLALDRGRDAESLTASKNLH